MKIKDFSDRLGIPPSKIRYYDSKGLIEGERNVENNYRDFSELAALDIYNASMLRSYGMSMEESAVFMNENAQSLCSWVADEIEELERNIHVLQLQKRRMVRMNDYLKNVAANDQAFDYRVAKDSYNFFSFGACKPSDEDLCAIELLAERMPYSYVAVRVSADSINEGIKPAVSVGLGILEENRALLEIRLPEYGRLEASDAVGAYFESENPFDITMEDLSVLLKEIHKIHPKLQNDLVGRVIFQFKENGTPKYCFSLGYLY